jgi:glycosyltransferase involved in cell wall biosynthesis
MRLALWSTGYFRGFGGAEKAVNDLLNRFSELGIDTFLIANRFNRDQRHNEVFEALHPNVRVYQNTFPNPLLFASRPLVFVLKLLEYSKASIQFGFFLYRTGLQLIHLHFVNLDVLLLILCRYIFRYRLVITFRGTDLALAKSSRLARFKVAVALRFADAVTAVSEDLCDYLRTSFHFQNPIYISNGVDRSKIKQNATGNTREVKDASFVYCGRLTRVKRVPFLISAFNESLKRRCQQYLYIIGDGEQREEVTELIKEFKIQDRVTILGSLKHCEALSVMSRCRCLVLSSASEGCPNVALEAMALGKPVIAPDAGGLKDIVRHGENGYLFPIDRCDVLSDLIITMAEDKGRASDMGKKAIETVTAKFDFEHVVQNYLRVYETFGFSQWN